MHIAELYRNHACLEDLTSELPDGIEYDREAECLRAACHFDCSARWGPFCFEIVPSPQDAHLSVTTGDSRYHEETVSDVTLFVRLKVKGERWLMLLNFAEAPDEENTDGAAGSLCNAAIIVNVQQETLHLQALRSLAPGDRLTARLSDEAPQRPAASRHLRCPRKRPASADAVSCPARRRRQQQQPPSDDEEDDDDEAGQPPGMLGHLRYCDRCGLFFTSRWMMEIHRRLHGAFAQPPSLPATTATERRHAELVLTAPVLDDRGDIAYVPVGLPKLPVPMSAAAASGTMRHQRQLQQESATNAAACNGQLSPATSPPQPFAPVLPDTPIDLTLPKAPPSPTLESSPLATTALRRQQLQLQPHQPSSSSRLRIRHPPTQPPPQPQQPQQPQQHQRKSATVSSLMSVCKDCKIGFFNYNNYVVHRTLYCQSSRLAAAAAAVSAASIGRAAKLQQQHQQKPQQRQQQQQQEQKEQLSPVVAKFATPSAAAAEKAAAAAAATSANQSPPSDRKFQCPYCQIRFHSPSTLTAHQAFYCPENPDKLASATAAAGVAAVTAAPAAAAVAAEAADVRGMSPQQQQPSPAWLPILPENSAGGFRCSVCGYIGQTERGMKMHAKVHSLLGTLAVSPDRRPDDAATAVSEGIQLPTSGSFASDVLSSMTQEELGMLQHKTQPYSKRRTFKRLGPHHSSFAALHQHHQQLQLPRHPSTSSGRSLLCIRCGEAFEQFESLMEHQETACLSATAPVIKLESAVRADTVNGRV